MALGSAVVIGGWIQRQRTIDLGALMGIVLLTAMLISLHGSFGWRVKALALITNLTLVGLYFPSVVGLRYTALAIAGAGTMVTAMFFGRRPAFILIAVDFCTILGYGIATKSGWINPPVLLLAGEDMFGAWLRGGIVFLTLSTTLTLMIGGLVESLETNVNRLLRVSEISNTNEEKYRKLIDYAPEAIVVFDLDQGLFVDTNPQAELLFGYTAAELKKLGPVDLSPELQENGRTSAEMAREYLARAAQGEVPVFEWIHKNKDGNAIPCEIRLLQLPTNEGLLIRGSITDIRERRKTQALIQNLALYDNLTGLPNRKLFEDRLQHAIAASERDRQYGAVFFVDVDNFKNINDTSGHASGDYFLTVVAERITGAVKESDTVARWGGDEFVIIVENLSHSLSEAGKKAEEIGAKMLEAVLTPTANPYVKGQFYQNSVSIGITLMYGHIHTADELLKRADIAMYQAKVSGKNRLRNFDVDMQKQVEERLALEADLKQALRKNEFEMHYQPQVNVDRKIVGAEILLRWRHPVRGFVFPGDFITLAEETGDIIEIGNWIVRMACTKLQEWQENPDREHLVLAINVSSRQFREPGFSELIGRAVRESGINPARLKLELTESFLLDNIEDTIQRMEELRAIGVNFSLDDFGTGYSSLSYLKQLPLSQLKIDQSFVQDITTDKNDAVLIRTIIGMAANLNLQVIAEGVETEEQLKALTEMGCLAYQGYYFSKPVPVSEFEKLFA